MNFWDYRYLYWHQNLTSAEPQQVLFAMVLASEVARRGLKNFH
jgi:hypothetical protein